MGESLHKPGPLAEEIAATKRRLAALEHQSVAATCVEMGHDWCLMGGANCGCEWIEDGETCRGMCSVPVHECRRCKDCDYGENPEGDMLRSDCATERNYI